MRLDPRESRDLGYYLSLASQITLEMLLPVVGGYLVDRWLGSDPWGMIGGAILGQVVAITHMTRISNQPPTPPKE